MTQIAECTKPGPAPLRNWPVGVAWAVSARNTGVSGCLFSYFDKSSENSAEVAA